MSRGPRIIVSLLLALAIFAGVAHFLHIPPDRYLPPPALYGNAKSYAKGRVTRSYTEDLSAHIFEGDATYYYEEYTFTPKPYHDPSDPASLAPSESPKPVTGAVRIANTFGSADPTGKKVTVLYDALNPAINGVPGTRGVWSKSTGFLNPYLWYYVGIILATLVIQEIIRTATRTNDFRA